MSYHIRQTAHLPARVAVYKQHTQPVNRARDIVLASTRFLDGASPPKLNHMRNMLFERSDLT